MKKLFAAVIFMFMFISTIYGVDIKNVVAYPVPFNPKGMRVLTIGYPESGSNFLSAENKSKVTVFDINGDVVTVINGSPSGKIACKWNGRRSNGSYAKPGLYLLKVEISDNEGGYWKKTLRVLVKY